MVGVEMRVAPMLSRCLVLVAALGLFAMPAAAHDSFPWPTAICSGGQVVGCWNPVPNVGAPVSDFNVSFPDPSKNTTPNPKNGDLYWGVNGGLPTIYYAYDDRGTATADDDFLFFRMRLNETPVLAVNGGSSPPLSAETGPFSSNTAWNFIIDVNGDGWADFAASTDGNTGKQQDPFDTYRLAYVNTPGSQLVTNDGACQEGGGGGQLLYLHKVNDADGTNSAGQTLDTCDFQLDPVCDFGFTRVINNNMDVSTVQDFFLDMQFPLAAFDDCSSFGTDDDTEVGTTLMNTASVPGEQLITPTTPFSICVTTSTQPNDFTNKDLAYNSAYEMKSTKTLPCGDPCTLADGCQEEPVFVELEGSCTSGSDNPTMTATVLDALQSIDGTTVVDTIDNVFFEYRAAADSTWTAVVPVSGTNAMTTPTSGVNEWSLTWDTSGLPDGDYFVRATATDEQFNSKTSSDAFAVTLGGTSCQITTTPVTLAWFQAVPDERGVSFEWSTASETANLGFNLYAHTRGGWQRVNDEPIPSQAVDSTEPLHYAYSARGLAAERFKIEDVATNGATRLHGPFRIGEAVGERPQPPVIDWGSFERQNEDSVAAAKGRKGRQALAVELRVDRDGIHRLTYEELRDAGFDFAGVPLAHLALTEDGEPRPLRVEGKGSFGPGAFIEFFGRGLDTLYTGTNVYRLAADPKAARRVAIDRTPLKGSSAPTTAYYESARVEHDRAYSHASPNGDPWYDERMLAFSTPKSWSFELPAEGYLVGVAPARLAVELWGVTTWPADPDHHVRLKVNGVAVADELFDGLQALTIEADVPDDVLRAGANTLTIELPADTGVAWDLVNVEAYSLTYPRSLGAGDGALVFAAAGERVQVSGLPSSDVSVYRFDGDQVTRLERLTVERTGGTSRVTFAGTAGSATYALAAGEGFLRPALAPVHAGDDLTRGAAEYLVISHPAFLDGLAPLVRERESRGLAVRVADVDDVIAQFGGGVYGAEPIRDFIAYAHAHLGTRSVLLVGGDTYDYRGYLGNGSMSFVPTLYAATGPLVGFAPSDSLLADTDGDGVQDLGIGRLPVRTRAELDTVIGKILDFERRPAGRSAVFAADAADAAAGLSFSAESENFLRWFPEWEVERAYIDSFGVAGARQRLIEAINEGATLTSFMGHSAAQMWSFSRLFTTRDVPALTNAGSPTVVLQAGCWNSYFVEPKYDTLGHALLLGGDRGAAAVVGSSTLTDALAHQEMARHLGFVLGSEPGITLGEALTRAKQRLAADRPELVDVLLGVTLLGDPATVLEP